MFDPSVLYDDVAGRFAVAVQVKDSTNDKAYVDFAVSNSSDATQGFTQKYQIEVDEGGKYWIDNGKFGFNADGYVFTGNLYSFAYGNSNTGLVLTVNKNALLNNNTLTDYLVNFSNNGAFPYGFSMIPARMHGSTAGGPMWFVQTDFAGANYVLVTRMDNVLSSAPTFTTFSVTVNSYGPTASGVQPGGTIDPGDSRTLNVEWNNNYLAAAFDSAVGTDPSAAWLEFNTSGTTPTIVQQGVIHPGTGISTYMPAVAVDANGDLGLTYMESSASEYMSMDVTGRLASDPAGTMETPVRVAAGTATGYSRVGDYSGMSLDPSSANTFWAGGEYDLSTWGTWLAAFQLTGGDAPPTVATAASANANPVTGTTTNLTVLGGDDTGESSLTYTWSVTSEPTGATNPAFSANGTNAAKNTTVSFSQAGSYTFKVTITDPANLTAASSVTVAVNQTLTSMTVTPGTASLLDNGTQQFTATALDQFGKALASQPAFTWTLTGIGTLNNTGMYTAPTSGTGTATAAASTATLSASASVMVASLPPSVVTPASATPNPVTGTTTNLSVLGTDASGASSLTYTWSVTFPAGAAAPTFSANGTNAAQNTTATFYQAGTYTFLATITDPSGLTATSSVSVTVNQTLTIISVTPSTATVPDTLTQQFAATALDQFGKSLATQPSFTWSIVSGIGTVSSGGMYTAPSSGTGSATVSAKAGTITGTTSVTVTALSIPATPSNLSATAVAKNQVNLSWTESSTIVTGFNIQRSSNGGKSWTQVAQVAGTVTTYSDTTVSKGKTYEYRMNAYNSAGTSSWTAPVTVTTPLQTPSLFPDPDVPTFNTTSGAVDFSRTVISESDFQSVLPSGVAIQRRGGDEAWITLGKMGPASFSETLVNLSSQQSAISGQRVGVISAANVALPRHALDQMFAQWAEEEFL
jgi:hypothetical protein